VKKIHLVCNAHIDPVWQWEWEEGASAAVSTFRAAADFCDEFDGFVFNHNEAILYQWVEEYEPELFERIKKHVVAGKWHIMGGWYLQPDCNMPSGESFVRQILLGRQYFKEKFGVTPTTAINFDAFGHSRGLVQIMKKSGFDSYLFTRPDNFDYWIKPGDFIWVGYDGSEIMAQKAYSGYNSLLGKAQEKIRNFISDNAEKELSLLLWGVGNHGGGPSRIDLNSIENLKKEYEEYEIIHSTPEQYFKELEPSRSSLPRVEADLNPRFSGCYTSQIRIKQKHRLLENELYLTEKMLTSANMAGLLKYPSVELSEAFKDLMTSEFHDILPGSSVQPVEETSLRILDHGLEIASRLKARAFFVLSAGQEMAKEGEYPILIYNPHPYKVKGIYECEFMLADQNWKEEFSMPVVFRNGIQLASQPEKELSNLNLDWRKRVVFEAELEPSQINRFDCRIQILPKKPEPILMKDNGYIHFKNNEIEVDINCKTGLIDKYKINGVDYLKQNSFLPLVIKDNDDPWRMDVNRFDEVEGSFTLMEPQEGTWFSGVSDGLLDSVRVIEDGEVRSVVEAVLGYNKSQICMTYRLPKKGTEVELQVRVNWSEKSKMLKLSIPSAFQNSAYFGQTAYGVEKFPVNGNEVVAQKWNSVVSNCDGKALTCINNGIYGSSCSDGEIRMTLLRSPGYCAHPIMERSLLPQDRYSPRIDQGERMYSFWINGGTSSDRQLNIDREALILNEKPYALSFFPSGNGNKADMTVKVENETILMTAMKKSEDGKGYIFRLFNPTNESRSTKIIVPLLGISQVVSLGGYEIKTLRSNAEKAYLVEVGLMEE
jgi:alpha-mannosidase